MSCDTFLLFRMLDVADTPVAAFSTIFADGVRVLFSDLLLGVSSLISSAVVGGAGVFEGVLGVGFPLLFVPLLPGVPTLSPLEPSTSICLCVRGVPGVTSVRSRKA